MNFIVVIVIIIGITLMIAMLYNYLKALQFIKEEYKHKKYKIMWRLGTLAPDAYFTDLGIKYLRKSQILQMILVAYFILAVKLLWR